MGYAIGRAFAGVTAAASFLVVLASVFLALISAGSAARSMPPGWFIVAAFGAMFVCASCFCMLAIFDIADRLRDAADSRNRELASSGHVSPPPIESPPIQIDERGPTPPHGHAAIDETSEPPPEDDRAAAVARRLAEYEGSKKK